MIQDMKTNHLSSTARFARGFTLVEAMVAISILSVAITGPLLIAQKGIASAAYSRDQITASYLAQEAIEYIRNARDTNNISGAPWLDVFDQVCVSPSVCRVDALYTRVRESDGTATPAVQGCTAGTCPKLNLNKTEGLYGYESTSGWTQTPFTRSVTITPLPIGTPIASANEVAVSVTVSWNPNLFSPVKSFSVKQILFNI